ncbi:MAG: hypothetical protein ACREJ6_15880, partial [Candidatus Methylomirabilis sp.]
GRPIGERDSMRWWPEGRDMRYHLSLHSYVMARYLRNKSRRAAVRPPLGRRLAAPPCLLSSP